ncbi:MAG: SDR family oxidoreductase [Deltaproteobacteria bacterium]|jgi:NAD(P)-dependent dehydrogenase (short-subunit alcohol dehydrogenase family)|nr:SDR family oxidoreductase [Deltaproteobacteria bacterium]MBW2499163.1 SDR family oxidoreductase [Deltaproteobacteria bacterium]
MPRSQIIVTGASRGIGRAVAVELARRDFAVVGLSRSGDVPAGRGLCCDVADESALCEAIAGVAGEGPIGGLVNNAGIHMGGPSAELSVAEYERVLRVNATSAMVASREVYPHLKAAGGGLIVNMGSFFDKVGAAQQLAYSTSKAALGAMTRVLAVEWARDGISVVNVAPGYIKTEFSEMWQDEKALAWLTKRIPLRRGGEPEEVARLVGALFSEQIGFLTGETIYMDGAHALNH